MELGPTDLFVATDPKTQDLLLEDWRWKVGNEAKVFRVTVFGDLFTQGPGGQIYWLETGSGRYIEVAKSVEQWADAAETHGEEWFHWATLSKLRSFGVKLGDGQVYSWRHDPMLGGAESVDNVDVVSLEVHVSNAGRTARRSRIFRLERRLIASNSKCLAREELVWRRKEVEARIQPSMRS